VSRVYLRKSGYKAMAYANSRGHGIAFDDIDNLPANYDAVKVLCDWMAPTWTTRNARQCVML
jgi:hypothetical protein